jgi:hypothetical protein
VSNYNPEDFAEGGEDDSPVIKQMRAQLKEQADQLKSKSAAERELAFIKAGVDTAHPVGQLLLESFHGDLSDIEGLKARAGELGVLNVANAAGNAAAQAGQGGEQIPLEPTGSAQRHELSGAGAEPPNPNAKPDPAIRAKEAFDRAVKAQASNEDAMAIWFGEKVLGKAEELGLVQ